MTQKLTLFQSQALATQPTSAIPRQVTRSRLVASKLALRAALVAALIFAPSWQVQVPELWSGQSLSFGVASAQSGGGFGGRRSSSSRSSSSRSSSSRSYSSGSRSSSRSYGGSRYGGGPVVINNSGGYSRGYGYSRSSGIGFFEMMVFLGIMGVVVFAMFGSMRRAAGGKGLQSGVSGTAQALSVQVLMMQGDEVKAALQEVARRGDPDSDAGLTRMLQEAALVVLRHPERWAYADVERAQGDASAVDSQVGAWATQARAAFTRQTTSHYQDNTSASQFEQDKAYQFEHDAGDMYLAVTVMVAAYTMPNLPPAGSTNRAEVQSALSAIGSISPDDLIRADVVWSPDASGEFLSETEAIMKYPNMTKI